MDREPPVVHAPAVGRWIGPYRSTGEAPMPADMADELRERPKRVRRRAIIAWVAGRCDLASPGESFVSGRAQ